jgi:hypothetical protein
MVVLRDCPRGAATSMWHLTDQDILATQPMHMSVTMYGRSARSVGQGIRALVTYSRMVHMRMVGEESYEGLSEPCECR